MSDVTRPQEPGAAPSTRRGKPRVTVVLGTLSQKFFFFFFPLLKHRERKTRWRSSDWDSVIRQHPTLQLGNHPLPITCPRIRLLDSGIVLIYSWSGLVWWWLVRLHSSPVPIILIHSNSPFPPFTLLVDGCGGLKRKREETRARPPVRERRKRKWEASVCHPWSGRILQRDIFFPHPSRISFFPKYFIYFVYLFAIYLEVLSFFFSPLAVYFIPEFIETSMISFLFEILD